MTPFARFLSKYLPRWAVYLAVTLVYSGTLLAVVLQIDRPPKDNIYLDIGRGQ